MPYYSAIQVAKSKDETEYGLIMYIDGSDCGFVLSDYRFKTLKEAVKEAYEKTRGDGNSHLGATQVIIGIRETQWRLLSQKDKAESNRL